ncbi:MAG: C39 family peptidase [Ktedonobacteraceae bacterium]|nr:C39 family peptidase [Ktedonobacteraceae bacterium]
MVIVLCTILAIALTITGVGVFLSFPRFHVSNQRNVYAQGMHPRSVDTYHPRDRTHKQDPHFRLKQSARDYIVESLDVPSLTRSYSVEWTRWVGIVVVLVSLFAWGLHELRTVLPTSALLIAAPWESPNQSTSSIPDSNVQLFSGMVKAASDLVPISQANPGQYTSKQQYDTWWSSTCSAASITEVINAYGYHHQLSDILQVETKVGEITPQQGLLEPTGIDRTVAQFGFKTTWLKNPSLDDVIDIAANHGRPVIVNFPPSRWAGGHILVVRGGNKDSVFLADSSLLNMQVMARSTFTKYWDGFAVVVTPQ